MKIEVLREKIEAAGFEQVPLRCLENNRKNFNLSLLQPEDKLRGGEKYIGPDNAALAKQKTLEFLRENAAWTDLLCTPEYFVPLEILKELGVNLRPRDGAIWILCLNGVTKLDLEKLIQETSHMFQWFHQDLSQFENEKMLNPVCHVLNIKNKSTGESKLGGAIHFKNSSMIDKKTFFESSNVQIGTECFLITNDGSSARLLTVICSDSMGFNPGTALREYDWSNGPYIIFHPQLNVDPRDPRIREYRSLWAAEASAENKLVIALNWSHNTEIPGIVKTPGRKFSFSSIYFRDEHKIKVRDEIIASNHEKGLYYARTQRQQTSLAILNFDEMGMQVECPCPSRTALPRDANIVVMPKVINSYTWADSKWLKAEKIDSGFNQISPWGTDPVPANLPNLVSEIEKERLILVSAGHPHRLGTDPTLISSFFADESEITKRIAFVQDDHDDSRNYRASMIAKFNRLRSSLQGGIAPVPESMEWASDVTVTLGFFPGGCNVRNANRNTHGLIVYVGETLISEVKATYIRCQQNLDSAYWNSLSVYYSENGVLRFESSINTDITEPLIDGVGAITKGENAF